MMGTGSRDYGAESSLDLLPVSWRPGKPVPWLVVQRPEKQVHRSMKTGENARLGLSKESRFSFLCLFGQFKLHGLDEAHLHG